MRLERSKDWWLNRARREGGAVIGAGLLAFDPAPDERPAGAPAEDSRIAFGKFVNLMRRRRNLLNGAQRQAVDAIPGQSFYRAVPHATGGRMMTKQIDLVKKLRDLGDHASFEPSAYHESADAIELLVKALEALARYHHCWCPFREEGKQCPGHEALVVLEKVRAMK